MSKKIRNPLNGLVALDLLPTISAFTPSHGLFADSGLFKEYGLKTNSIAYNVENSTGATMTKLNSRTERDKTRVSKKKGRAVTANGVTIALDGGIHVEDIQNRIVGIFEEDEKTVRTHLIQEVATVYDSFAQSYEYLLVTASQGRARNPEDGSVAVDMFEINGVQQNVFDIDLSATSTTVKADLNELKNRLSVLNAGYGTISTIEVWVAENVFDAIAEHDNFLATTTWAYAGRGAEAVAVANQNHNAYIQGKYGHYREFRYENFVFRTYPSIFTRLDGTVQDIVADGEGWTVVRGARDSYEVGFAPAPYFSELTGVGKKILAKTDDKHNDVNLDFTIESHLTPILKRPELSFRLRFDLG
jgi:hypothetical protein